MMMASSISLIQAVRTVGMMMRAIESRLQAVMMVWIMMGMVSWTGPKMRAAQLEEISVKNLGTASVEPSAWISATIQRTAVAVRGAVILEWSVSRVSVGALRSAVR